MDVWRPTALTPTQLEARRFEGARLLRAGRLRPAEIARQLGVSRQAVSQWQHALEHGGRAALRRRAHTGRPPQLDGPKWRHLRAVLQRGARAAGFETERWTLRRIQAVVWRECGVRYHCRSLGRVLHARGWSPQRPPVQAKERDEALIKAWLARDWPRIKRGLAGAGASLPSWTKRVSRFGPASPRRGLPSATRPSSAGSRNGGRSRVSSR
jgi:transposase